MLLHGLSLVAVRLTPLVDVRIRSNFHTVLHHLPLSWSLCVCPSHEASLQSALRIEQLLQQTVQTHFLSTHSSFWIRNLKVSHCLHLFAVTWASMWLQKEYSCVLLDAEYHKCNMSLNSQSSTYGVFRDPIMKISMAGGNFSSSPRCQNAYPSLIQS